MRIKYNGKNWQCILPNGRVYFEYSSKHSCIAVRSEYNISVKNGYCPV